MRPVQGRQTQASLTDSRQEPASVAAIDSPSRPIRPMRALSPAPTAVPRSDGGATCESASLKKPTGKGRQTCRPARGGVPFLAMRGCRDASSHFREIASTFPESCLEGYNSFKDFLFLSSGGRPAQNLFVKEL